MIPSKKIKITERVRGNVVEMFVDKMTDEDSYLYYVFVMEECKK